MSLIYQLKASWISRSLARAVAASSLLKLLEAVAASREVS
eukprot:SAG25_NODE_7890_length_451_cov_1.315341_1_plen_39_part_01